MDLMNRRIPGMMPGTDSETGEAFFFLSAHVPERNQTEERTAWCASTGKRERNVKNEIYVCI